MECHTLPRCSFNKKFSLQGTISFSYLNVYYDFGQYHDQYYQNKPMLDPQSSVRFVEVVEDGTQKMKNIAGTEERMIFKILKRQNCLKIYSCVCTSVRSCSLTNHW